MPKTLFFLFALLCASLALANPEREKTCAQRAREAREAGSVDGVVASVGDTSLFTLAWRGRRLYHLTDHSDRIGKIFRPFSELTALPFPPGAWQNIGLLAVQSEAHSIMGSRAKVALADADGSVFVFDTDEMQAARLPYQAGRFLVSLALARGETTQLAIFSNQGIETTDLPERLDHEVRLAPRLIYPATDLKGGFAVQRDDFVAYRADGQILRFTEGHVRPIGKMPQGIRALGGYLNYRQLRLWAVDKMGVLWCKSKERSPFRRTPFQLPPGVQAMRLTATAKMLYPESPFREEWVEGHFSRTAYSATYGMNVERVFIVGDDGGVYSPFPPGENPSVLSKIELGQDFIKAAGMDFPIELTSLMKGSRLSPADVRLKMKQLAEERELVSGKPRALSAADQRNLLRTWLTNLVHERFLDTPGAEIDASLDKIGVPKQRAARLIFLACLSVQEADSILMQRDLEKNWDYFKEVNRLLMTNGHDFRREFARSGEARRMLEYLAVQVRTHSHPEKDRILDQVLEAPFAHQPMYFALDAFLAQRTFLWHWDLQREIDDDTQLPGPKGTTGGASAE